MTKKILFLTLILVIFFTPSLLAAQCNLFEFPKITKGQDITFFDCDTGDFNIFTKENTLNPVPAKKSLGAFIHNLIWSPNGESVLILSENVSAAKQELTFYSPNRRLNSLNWWIYNINTGEALLLDEHILLASWISDDEIIYNWDNKNFARARINNLGQFAKIADITQDQNSLSGLSTFQPVVLNDIIFFPMEKGFYSLRLDNKESFYNPLPENIKKAIINNFTNNSVVIQTEKALSSFSFSENILKSIDADFNAKDIAFYNQDSLVIADDNGQVYSYDINSKTKTRILLASSGEVSRVYSSGQSDEFLFVIGQNVYRKIIDGKDTMLFGLKTKVSPAVIPEVPSEEKSYVFLIILAAIMVISIPLIIIFFKKRRA